MQIFLSPEDVWLFRDGRPFDAASNHRARSIFPPFPTVTQGAIRSNHLVVKGVDLTDKDEIEACVGTSTDFRTLCMRGPFIAKLDGNAITRYYPLPADAFPKKFDSDEVQALLPSEKPDDVFMNELAEDLPMLLFPRDFQPGKKKYGNWITEGDLEKYIHGKAIEPVQEKCLFVKENRVGIRLLPDQRSVEEGMLYEAEFIRPKKGVGLYLDVNGYDSWPNQGSLRLGGEGHIARYVQIDTEPPNWASFPVELPTRYKVYFISPTYFENGWLPSNGWEQFFEGKIELRCVALRGYDCIGGYDYVTKSDKPSRRFVPAGSVYFFQSLNGQVKIKQDLIQNAITEFGPKIGFGQVKIAEW